MIFTHPEQDISSPSVIYDSDTGSEDRPSESTRIKIQANFEIARPAPKFSLRLGPKLLLQIQQCSHNHRAIPVLEIWQPPLCKSKLMREFHEGVKLRSGDIYATLDESYITSLTKEEDPSISEQRSDGIKATPYSNIIAAICHDEKDSNIHFRNARCSWRASTRMAGLDKATTSYRFTMNNQNGEFSDEGRMILQWEKRRRETITANSEDTDQFVLLLIDRKARKKSRIATMTMGSLKIIVRKSSILDGLKACYELMEPIDSEESNSTKSLEVWLYTLTLTLGVLVRYKEGWL
ncbi:hypothetical protein N7540_004480 [Penicillium herquei]|nr:hypothetical protein N7540_004480 [Penicillium herquei]